MLDEADGLAERGDLGWNQGCWLHATFLEPSAIQDGVAQQQHAQRSQAMESSVRSGDGHYPSSPSIVDQSMRRGKAKVAKCPKPRRQILLAIRQGTAALNPCGWPLFLASAQVVLDVTPLVRRS